MPVEDRERDVNETSDSYVANTSQNQLNLAEALQRLFFNLQTSHERFYFIFCYIHLSVLQRVYDGAHTLLRMDSGRLLPTT